MRKEKYYTCRHSTRNIGNTVVYVKPTCPRYTKIRGSLVSSKRRCRDCPDWEKRKAAELNLEFEKVVEEMRRGE